MTATRMMRSIVIGFADRRRKSRTRFGGSISRHLLREASSVQVQIRSASIFVSSFVPSWIRPFYAIQLFVEKELVRFIERRLTDEARIFISLSFRIIPSYTFFLRILIKCNKRRKEKVLFMAFLVYFNSIFDSAH